MHILHVVGARPNFMKVAPVLGSLDGRNGTRQTLVHTGQHYDANMSEVFFEQLALPRPDVNLAVGSGSQARQTAEIMARFEEVALESKPDLVVVYGDVNSTVAAALVCAKLLIPVAHVEAGLRSFDRTMPEEINRLLTDQISDLLFTPSPDGDENLAREGIAKEKIHLVGNVMIDTLVRLLEKAEQPSPASLPDRYVLVTLHRPSNVDDGRILEQIVCALLDIGQEIAIVFPVHPRTRERLGNLGIDLRGFHLLEPVPYLEFLGLQRRAAAVITDSGGVQEETTYLGVPCLTLRENTERPVTVTLGTNVIVGHDMDRLRTELKAAVSGRWKSGQVPPLWDGHAGERIAAIIS
jgi:UDP-N-acetylglucosamine 2-epimerase (non-hydrolysing)